MTQSERVAAVFHDAIAAFEVGAIGERELLAIGMAVNDEICSAAAREINRAALESRMEELSQ